MDNEAAYRNKLTTAAEAVRLVPKKGYLSIGLRSATPPALCAALADRALAGEIEELKVYYMRCGNIAIKTIFQEALLDRIHPYSSMMTGDEVKLATKGFELNKKYIHYVPITFSRYANVIKKNIPLDVFMVTVSPMDKFGYFNFGLNGDYAIELARHAKKLIVEVNKQMPRVGGNTALHISEVTAIVENHVSLAEEPSRPFSDLDKQIGANLIDLIPHGATIQMGIGGVPNAVCSMLTHHQHLGIHTEVFTAGLKDLVEAGVVTNSQKTLNRYMNIFTFAIGDRKLYDFLDNNPSMGCYPASYTNNPAIIAKNKNMISVNAFVELDLNGQVNAEFIGHQFSGVGGQLDFMRGAQLAEGGRSILASSSTAAHETVSRIVPRIHGITTDTRLDIDCVVTEYGRCDLIGKSTTERALGLINIAHPKFRDELLAEAKKLHMV